ncbi:uncharacterized protein LOC116295419 [Actinia tenebrosa]|uniref:Uncharacterized protein LOC116295419 n=1 Tax=Actinia tenebrosa TaxID=6105 RepID=A0A6P8I2J5_ACTTE|nr:uncharacterized protein LOC116295419 [Actinia tenebrosa]
MAKKYPDSERGLWNDLPCNNPKSFICEYDQGNYKCNSSKIFFCEHKTKPTERAVTTTVCTISDPDPDRFNLLYVVIALGILLAGGIVFYIYIFYCKNRNSGFSNGCQEYKTFKFKNRTLLGLEEGATPLQTEPPTETVVEDDSNKTDREMEMEMENSAGLENPAQDALTEDSLNKDYTSPVDPSSTSTYASLYSSVEVEQKKPEESEDVKPPKVPSPHHEVSREPVVYAMIDKSKKTNKKNSQIEVVYATVDKKRRDTKVRVDIVIESRVAWFCKLVG